MVMILGVDMVEMFFGGNFERVMGKYVIMFNGKYKVIGVLEVKGLLMN